MTKIVQRSDIQLIISELKKGKIVAFATDTVFGVGVIYNNYEAVKRLKAAKGRDENKPFPLMVYNSSQMHQVAFLNEREEAIVEKITPGPLTLVLRKKPVINSEFTSGKDTIAIRIPDDDFVLKILQEVGPMFVTSANLSNHPSANNTAQVVEQLDGKIDYIVDGESKSHTASTIIDCTGKELVVLREGEISINDIKQAVAC
ncbi:MAG: L-threonylcarbamoyladenylate synthase [Erysipelotrichaceae bacterium]